MKLQYQKIQGFVFPTNEWPDLPYKIITEGEITFRIPDSKTIYDAPAFFNPEMALNRDLAILFSIVYSKRLLRRIRIFEPLAGLGIRGFRLAIEAKDYIEEAVINDYNRTSTSITAFNQNEINPLNLYIFNREARALIYELNEKHAKFNFIDLDPFGSPSPFIDAVWISLVSKSILAVTATDMTALCGIYPDACLRKYSAIPLNNYHTHETAARILIGSIVISGARHGKGVRPIFTASVDHYTKVFFEIKSGRGVSNEAAKTIGFSYTCKNCFQITYLKGLYNSKFECCGEIQHAGPLWTGELFDPSWCDDACKLLEVNEQDFSSPEQLDSINLPTSNRIIKMLNEGINGWNLKGYYAMDELTKKLKITQPKIKLVEETLKSKGYNFVNTHFRKQSFRTDAPPSLILEIISELVPRAEL